MDMKKRNEDLFYDRLFYERSYQQLADKYGISIERARQIVGKQRGLLIERIDLVHRAKSVLRLVEQANKETSDLIATIKVSDIKSAQEFICVKNLDFTIRTKNALHWMGVKDLCELCECSESDLLRQPNLGMKSMNEIKNVMKAHGLYLSTVSNWKKKDTP